MFEQHFHLKENPFAAGHQPRFVYPSREHQEAIAHLRYGVENHEPFVLITGEVGTGKTTAVFNALNQLSQRASVALITNSALNRVELLEEICLRFGMQLEGTLSKPQLLAQLERHLQSVHARGERSVLIVDEAQNLSRDLLEEIRLLSNLESQGDSMLQIFLVGQPELSTRLLQPELRQLRQRITVRYRLRPLDGEETEHYIHHRISVAGGNAWQIFPAIACRVVFDLTGGVPREINTVASQALLNAFVEDAPQVEPRHVQSVASEMGFESVVGVQEKTEDDTAVPTETEETAAPATPAVEVPAATTPPSSPLPEPSATKPEDEWEPPVAQAIDEPSPSYPDLGIDDIYAEVVTIEPEPELPSAPVIPAAVTDLGIEAIGDDLPAEPQPAPAIADATPVVATPPPSPLGSTRLEDVATEPAPEAKPVAAPRSVEPPKGVVSAAMAKDAATVPSLEADADVPWVEPDFGSGSKLRPKPDLLAALRTELQQKYDAPGLAETTSAEPLAPATMLANLEHPTSKASEPGTVVPALDYVPERLRARLEAMEREQSKPRRRIDGYAVAWMALVGVAIIVAVIVWSRLRHVPTPRGQHTGAAVVEPEGPSPPAAGSRPAASPVASPSAPASAPKTTSPPSTQSAREQMPPRAAAPKTTSSPPSTQAAAGTLPARAYGVQVAVFQTEERATQAQASLSRLAGHSGRVLHSDGDVWYRVVLGEFSSADSAAHAGAVIVERGWVDDYLVVPLARGTAAVRPTPR